VLHIGRGTQQHSAGYSARGVTGGFTMTEADERSLSLPTQRLLEGITLLPRAEEPAYRGLARAIRECIQSGFLRPGDLLPTKRELAAALHVSVATVRHAYDVLAREAYLVPARGLRTRVAGPQARRSPEGGRPPQGGQEGANHLQGRVRAIEPNAAGVCLVLDLEAGQEVRVVTSQTAIRWLGLAPGRVATVTVDRAAMLLTPLTDEARPPAPQ
jgi:hypothetical protein